MSFGLRAPSLAYHHMPRSFAIVVNSLQIVLSRADKVCEVRQQDMFQDVAEFGHLCFWKCKAVKPLCVGFCGTLTGEQKCCRTGET